MVKKQPGRKPLRKQSSRRQPHRRKTPLRKSSRQPLRKQRTNPYNVLGDMLDGQLQEKFGGEASTYKRRIIRALQHTFDAKFRVKGRRELEAIIKEGTFEAIGVGASNIIIRAKLHTDDVSKENWYAMLGDILTQEALDDDPGLIWQGERKAQINSCRKKDAVTLARMEIKDKVHPKFFPFVDGLQVYEGALSISFMEPQPGDGIQREERKQVLTGNLHPNGCPSLIYHEVNEHVVVFEQQIIPIRNKYGLPLRLRIKVVQDLVRYVKDVLHKRDFIHRDINPNNYLVDCVLGEEISYRGRVIDLGSMKSLKDKDQKQEGFQQTLVTRLQGTPTYMAPEQTFGDHCIQSDIYGLAAVLYEIVTGMCVTPHSPGSSQLKVLSTVQQGLIKPQDPLYVEALQDLNTEDTELLGNIRPVMQRGLQREPKDRHNSATELYNAMERVLNGEKPEYGRSPPVKKRLTDKLLRRKKDHMPSVFSEKDMCPDQRKVTKLGKG